MEASDGRVVEGKERSKEGEKRYAEAAESAEFAEKRKALLELAH
jgi:hypothetical protein